MRQEKTTAPTTSAGTPTLPKAVRSVTYFEFSGVESHSSFNEVRTYPGPTQFTRTAGPHRAANALVVCINAALLA